MNWILTLNKRRLLHFFGTWYVIWFAVGLFSIGFQWPSVFFHIEDMLFMVLAGIVLLLEASIRLGWQTTLKLFLWIAGFSGLVEYIGATTGFPFGDYVYTHSFGPRLAGELPIAIPFAWWVVVFPLHLFWSTVFRRHVALMLLVPVCVGLSAVAIDLALEPVATIGRSYWLWSGDNGIYYGVPLSNFIAWFCVATLISVGLKLIAGSDLRHAYKRRGAFLIPIGVLLAVLLSFLVGALVAKLWLAVGVILLNCSLLVIAARYEDAGD